MIVPSHTLTTMSRLIALLCDVYGDPDAQPFEVEIDEEKTCSALKKLLKKERSPDFDRFAIDRLKLWKWNNIAEVKAEDLRPDNVLDSRMKICDVFRDDPPETGLTHIIAMAPSK